MVLMKEVSFETILAALINPDGVFPARYLPRLSDLSPAEVRAFAANWTQVPLKRQRSLLRQLQEHFDTDTLLSYEALAVSLLTDPDAEVRTLALRLLEETIDARLIPTLTRLLKTDPEPEARARAAIVLGQFVRLGEMEELPLAKRHLVEEALIEAARTETAVVARAALEALGYSGRSEVDELIGAAFKHADPLWQATALFAAGRSADARWQEQILNGLLSEDAPVRLAAATSAGELELKTARKMLIEMLEDEEDDDVLQAAIWSLSQIGGEDVRTYLEALLAEAVDDEQVEFIEEALVNLSFTEDLEQFDLLAVDPDELDEVDDED
jgi:HEAT repeat protein